MNLHQLLLVVAQSSGRVLSASTAGYLALQVLRALREPPSRAPLEGIVLTSDGRVAVRGAEACTAAELEVFLRGLLGSLLQGMSAVPPAFRRVCGSSASAGLQCLEAELLSALIPINGAASRRALARLCRACGEHPLGRDAQIVGDPAAAGPSAPRSLREEIRAPYLRQTPLPSRAAAALDGATDSGESPSPPLACLPRAEAAEEESERSFQLGQARPTETDECDSVVPACPEGVAAAIPPSVPSQATELAGRFLAREQSPDCIAQRLRRLVGVAATSPGAHLE